jgi:hypothetical protein
MLGQAQNGRLQDSGWPLFRNLGLFCTLAAVASVAGCTRAFYRNQADKDVQQVLTEKNTNPDWAIKAFHVYPDPRARFADPTNPDRPPMPPDDPAAWNTAPHPQKPGKAGVAYFGGTGYLDLLAKWDAENRMNALVREEESSESKKQTTVINPIREAKPLEPDKEKKPFLITLEQAAEMGMMNSREFQDAREDLYLAALPVTRERFAFNMQWFGIMQAIREVAGKGFEGPPPAPTNDWTLNSTAGFAKLFSTGALMLFSVANQTIFEFGGPHKGTTSVSTMMFDITQPLLRGGGKAVTLEPLTQAERDLLYQIRVYDRFRKSFFVAIAGGGGGSITGAAFVPTNVVGSPTFAPGQGIRSAFLTPGVIDPNGTANVNGLSLTPSSTPTLNLTKAIPPTISGYLGTLLQYAQINIDQDNINRLEGFYKLFQAYKEGGDVSQLQVDLVESQLQRGYNSLYSDQAQYYAAVDAFKLQLGLPTDLPLFLDDTQLRPLIRQFKRYEDVLAQYDEANKQVTKLGTGAYNPRLRAVLLNMFRTVALSRGTKFRTRLPGDWARWKGLSDEEIRDRLKTLAERRRRLLDEKTDLETPGRTVTAADKKRLEQIDREVRKITYQTDLGNFELAMREYERKPWEKERRAALRRSLQDAAFRAVSNLFILILIEARNERFETLHKQWPDVPGVRVEGKDLLRAPLDEAEAIVDRVTLTNRLDLMNIRAQLNDAWRAIAIFANSLLGTFNVQYRMVTNTPLMQAKPLDFGGDRTLHQLILNGELPLVRREERNAYRAGLIAFQRQRRALMEAEDLAMQSVRGEIRSLRQLEESFKIQERVIELAYFTVENSLDVFQQTQPPATAGTVADTATRAAALVSQLLMAQANLPIAQNAVLTAYVNYMTSRYQLYRDLELMPLDARGVWIDDNATSDRNGAGDCRPGSERNNPATRSDGDRGNEAGPTRLPAKAPPGDVVTLQPE